MTITYTGNLKLALPTTGTEAGTWGDVVNQQITALLDQSVSGTVSLTSMTNADYTLTNGNGSSPNEARYMALSVPSTLTLTAARNIIVPSTSKAYIIRNLTTGGFAVTLKTSAGTGVSVPNGKTMALYCDGTNVIDGTDYLASLTLGTALPVLSGGTGVTTSTGTGSVVLNTSPTLVTPALGTPSSGVVTNLTGTANITVTGGASGAIAATTLSASSTVSGAGFSTYLASPPAIGGTAAAAVSSTNLSYTGTLTGGTGIVNIGSGQVYKDASGNVGIGVVPSGQWKLDLLTVGTGGARISTAEYGQFVVSDGSRGVYIQNYASAGVLGTSSANRLSFATDNVERMTIDTSGNLGIGTSSPGYKLDVAGNISSSSEIISQGVNARFSLYRSTGINYFDWASGQALYFSTQTSSGGAGRDTKMTLDASGNLGIGTSSPGAKTQISRGTGATAPTTISKANAYLGLGATEYNTGSYRLIGFGYSNTEAQYPAYFGYIETNSSGATYGDLAFYTRNVTTDTAPSERMRLDASGNLGLGVTPSAWSGVTALQIVGGGAIGFSSQYGEIDTNTYYNAGYKYIGTGLAAKYDQAAGLHRWYTAPSGTAGNAITFTQAMTLDASGNLLVGKTAASQTTIGFETDPTGSVSSTMASAVSAQSTFNVYSTGAGAYRFYVGMNGVINATSTAINAISDQRLKENIQDLDVGLDKIMALQPRKFDWKAGKGKDIKGDRGFIAQEFEQVFPDLIDEWKDPAPEGEEPYKAVRADLIPVLVKAIQEQQALITSLTARIAALEAK